MSTTIIITVGTSTFEKTKYEKLPWNIKEPNDVKYIDKGDNLETMCRNYTNNNLYNLPNFPTERFNSAIMDISNLYINVAKEPPWEQWDDKGKKDTWRIMPAEIGSTLRIVQRLKVKPEEVQIVLMVSDTGHSYVCAGVIQNIFESLGFDSSKIELRMINGFQMEDINKFSNIGLPNFISTINEYVSDDEEDRQLFNITGGYKNFIPLITHIASFYRKDMYYVFEESISSGIDSLIKIPKIPTLNRILGIKSVNSDVLRDFLKSIEGSNYISIKESLNELKHILLDYINLQEEFAEEIINSYLDFVEDFLEMKEKKVCLSIIGSIYILLLETKVKELT